MINGFALMADESFCTRCSPYGQFSFFPDWAEGVVCWRAMATIRMLFSVLNRGFASRVFLLLSYGLSFSNCEDL